MFEIIWQNIDDKPFTSYFGLCISPVPDSINVTVKSLSQPPNLFNAHV